MPWRVQRAARLALSDRGVTLHDAYPQVHVVPTLESCGHDASGRCASKLFQARLRPAEGRTGDLVLLGCWCLRQIECDPDEPRRVRTFAMETQRLHECQHRGVAFQHVAVKPRELLASCPSHQSQYQMPAEAHAADEKADENREFGLAGAGRDRDAGDRSDQRLARRHGFGHDQCDFALRVRATEPVCGFGGQFLDRVKKALADLVGAQQAEPEAQWLRVLGPDRPDQYFTTIEQPFVLVPGR